MAIKANFCFLLLRELQNFVNEVFCLANVIVFYLLVFKTVPRFLLLKVG